MSELLNQTRQDPLEEIKVPGGTPQSLLKTAGKCKELNTKLAVEYTHFTGEYKKLSDLKNGKK